MKIIGTREELEWIKESLANNCEGCIFEELCNQFAKEELKREQKVVTSCKDFLEEKIKFVIIDELEDN